MGVVTSRIEIEAPLKDVFALAHKVEDYPAFMPDVKTVEVRDRRDDGYSLTYWEALVSIQSINKVIRWEEEAQWNIDDMKCVFSQTKGDYKSYTGEWNFQSTDTGSIVELKVDFDLGLPLVGALINKLLDKLMRENCDSMLKALKEKAEGKAN
jgi:ribosome-associated toxin RatA of RatAB toxin-antitoxin module